MKIGRPTLAALLAATLLLSAGCGAMIVGGGAAAVGTYAYVNGQSIGTYDADIATAFAASKTACNQLGIPVIKEKMTRSDGEIQGKLSGELVTISLKTVGAGLTEISVRVGLWGNKASSRRIHSAINQHL